VLGLIYFIAFTSFGVQAQGLIGSHGIAPAAEFFKAIQVSWEAPSLLRFFPSDAAITANWVLGATFALAAVVSPWPRTALAVCLVLWVSLCVAGQDFLSFQWDSLLSEVGFLAVFADSSIVRVWLFRWLLFRLMFSSGAVKLLSGDPAWHSLTAMSYH